MTKAARYKTRTPDVQSRDPEPAAATREPRRFITASMPTTCPDCGHHTRMSNGRYIDPANRKILEYRDCVECDAKLAASRDMTAREVERFCTHADAVKQYHEQTEKKVTTLVSETLDK